MRAGCPAKSRQVQKRAAWPLPEPRGFSFFPSLSLADDVKNSARLDATATAFREMPIPNQ
jgi:hypothetical protein